MKQSYIHPDLQVMTVRPEDVIVTSLISVSLIPEIGQERDIINFERD